MNTQIIRCIIACHNASGEPDLYFVKIKATQDQIDDGEHYEEAIRSAEDNDYEGPFIAFDENDDAGRAMLGLLEWDTASEYDLT